MTASNPADEDEDGAAAISRLGDEDIAHIDQLLLNELRDYWQKRAMVVGGALIRAPEVFDEIPDWFFPRRLVELQKRDLIEGRGDLEHMRSSEVRLKPSSTHPKRQA
jgi:hypothetical protein